jgi:hypothetical protein
MNNAERRIKAALGDGFDASLRLREMRSASGLAVALFQMVPDPCGDRAGGDTNRDADRRIATDITERSAKSRTAQNTPDQFACHGIAPVVFGFAAKHPSGAI